MIAWEGFSLYSQAHLRKKWKKLWKRGHSTKPRQVKAHQEKHLPFFSQIAGSKASDGYCTTYSRFLQGLQVVKPEKATALLTAHFFQRLQVVKPENATALLTAHFFPEIAGSKAREGYCTTYCPFCPEIAGSKAWQGYCTTYCPFFPEIAGSKA